MGLISIDDLEGRTRSVSESITEGTEDAVITGPLIVFGMKLTAQEGGAARLQINDALTVAAGGTTITLRASTGRTVRFDFEPTGILFQTGLSRVIEQDVDVNVYMSQIMYIQI